MKQSALARNTKLQKQAINAVIKFRHEPKINVIGEIAQALDVSPAELLEDPAYKKPDDLEDFLKLLNACIRLDREDRRNVLSIAEGALKAEKYKTTKAFEKE